MTNIFYLYIRKLWTTHSKTKTAIGIPVTGYINRL